MKRDSSGIMETDDELENYRLKALKEHESILCPNKANHGPGTINMAQIAMIAEVCAANFDNYLLNSYSVLSDPELFRLAMIASSAADELNSAMQERLRL